MDQELVPDQDMPSDDSFEQAVRDEGDVADTAATEIKTARSKESKKTGGDIMLVHVLLSLISCSNLWCRPTSEVLRSSNRGLLGLPSTSSSER